MDHDSHPHHHTHEHEHTPSDNTTKTMAAAATLHCLTGCAIGEILGLLIGTATNLGTGWTAALSIALAFLFGYTLSTLPLIKSGLSGIKSLKIVLTADTLSIATMELVDNAVMVLIPGAMSAGLVNSIFWLSMPISLTVAFAAAYPVNLYLLHRGKGHALTHQYHHSADNGKSGFRRYIPTLSPTALAAMITSFLIGGLVVSIASELL